MTKYQSTKGYVQGKYELPIPVFIRSKAYIWDF